MSYLEKVDGYFDSLKIGKSAVVDSWFMMSSPIPILSVIGAYLIFLRVGPKIMKNRPPLKMNKVISYYNAAQVVLAAMICIKVLFSLGQYIINNEPWLLRVWALAFNSVYSSLTSNPGADTNVNLIIAILSSVTTCWTVKEDILRKPVFKLNLFRDGIIYAGCRYPSNTQNPMLLDLGWWYFFAKFTELLDTVFFVLRKKNKQLTFLHVYHHVIMALYSWSYLKFAAAGEGAVLALLNSAVHVVMYTYYLLSGLGPQFQKYLWWKKYVTTMQLIQFVLMLSYCAWTHFSPRCQYAPGFTYFISANVTIFLILFLNFYAKNYRLMKNKELKSIYNSVKANGNSNGVTKISDNEMELAGDICKGIPNMEDSPCEVEKACGEFIKDGRSYLTRRSGKCSFSSECGVERIIKK